MTIRSYTQPVYPGILDIFKPRSGYRSRTLDGKMASSPHKEDSNEESIATSEEWERDPLHADSPLTLADITEIAADIKKLVTSAITDLKTEIKNMSEQLTSQERASKKRDKAINRLELISEKHSNHRISINRHLEDVDNRGRKNNVRVRGMPENITPNQTSFTKNI